MELYLWERIGYIMLWIVNGIIIGIFDIVTVMLYYVVAAVYWTDDDDFAKTMKNLWITMALVGLWYGKTIWLFYENFTDSLFYMLGTEINTICDKYPDLCKGWGLKWWWNSAWNDEICYEEENGDCSPLDSAAESL